MESLTEFCLTTLWNYTSKAIKRVLDGLTEIKSDIAEITYDTEYEWFKVICLAHEADGIRQEFYTIAREIEQDAFKDGKTNILNEHEAIRPYFDNEWFRCQYDSLTAEELDELHEAHGFPEAFSEYPKIAIWDHLDRNEDDFTFQDIMTSDQLNQINRDTGVSLSCNLSGRLVYIGGNDEESVCLVQNKLTIMLLNKKISSFRYFAQHLLYAEDYVDRDYREFSADIRYLANIDPKLVSSTLLDRVVELNLEEAYQGIYQEGASIRLCSWDPTAMCHLSLLGPKVIARPSARHSLGNRPVISAKVVDTLHVALDDLTISEQDRSAFRAHVATWIKALPDDVDTSSDEEETPEEETAKDEVTKEEVAEGETAKDSSPPSSAAVTSDGPHPGGLMIAVGTSSAQAHGQPGTPSGNDGKIPETGPSLAHRKKTATTPGKLSKSQSESSAISSATPEAQTSERQQSELSFTGPDCLIDMLDAVETPTSSNTLLSGIRWGMPALIPSSGVGEAAGVGKTGTQERRSVTKNRATGNQNPISSDALALRSQPAGTTDHKVDARFKGFLKSGSPDFQPTHKPDTPRQLGTPKALDARFKGFLNTGSPDFQPTQTPDTPQRDGISEGSDSSPASAETQPTQLPKPKALGRKNLARAGTQPSQPPKPQEPLDSNQLPDTNKFVEEIEAAMYRLLCSGPYRRGKVSVRAEFGRAIFEGVDPTGLSFNGANSRSDGWEKADLVRQLNANYARRKNFHFTKILSTYGPDVEAMININAKGAPIWAKEPSRAWTTYSFYCNTRRGSSTSNKTASTENLVGFIVDIEDHGSSADPFTYLIRPPNHGRFAERLMPVYIHAVLRHWDLRLVMSHIDTTDWELVFGPFARTLMKSLDIVPSEKRAPELTFAVHSSFPVEVNEVRILTKWRHPSVNGRTELEITEVEQLELGPGSDVVRSGEECWKSSSARPWTPRETKDRRAKGESPRWYEVAVVSPAVEKACRQNETLGLGEMADWDVGDLKERGILADIYGPALQMLKEMDHVGRNDDNNLAKAYGPLLLQPNDPPRVVPGVVVPGAGFARAQGSETW